jgi:hypothetical protein
LPRGDAFRAREQAWHAQALDFALAAAALARTSQEVSRALVTGDPMTRNHSIAALAALACFLAACNEPPPAEQTGSATPASPPVPPPQAVKAPEASPQARLEADMELSSKVKAVVQEPAKSNIEVAANDGVVTLYGTVDAPADKDRIALAAMGVEGVRSVVNNLVVLRGS